MKIKEFLFINILNASNVGYNNHMLFRVGIFCIWFNKDKKEGVYEVKKTISIGVSDFKELIEGNNYFIDKSILIKEFLENGAKIILTPRPRRFGKTLNLSMLRYFFDIRRILHYDDWTWEIL